MSKNWRFVTHLFAALRITRRKRLANDRPHVPNGHTKGRRELASLPETRRKPRRSYEETKRTRAERISGRTTQRRNVICCLRKTIKGSVAEGHESSVGSGRESPRAGPSSPPEVRGLSLPQRRAVVGETISIILVVALMFYEDTCAFLQSVESQFVWENRTLFPPRPLLSFSFILLLSLFPIVATSPSSAS